jgi:hypothetical protein
MGIGVYVMLGVFFAISAGVILMLYRYGKKSSRLAPPADSSRLPK